MQKEYRTKSRDDIMSYIEEHKERRFSASDVYNHLKSLGSKTNLTTVYRNLEKLMDTGVLLQLGNTKDGCALYQVLVPEKKCHEHLHIQCSSCGQISHAEEELMEFVEGYFERHGYSLIPGESVLIGLCADCRSKQVIPV